MPTKTEEKKKESYGVPLAPVPSTIVFLFFIAGITFFCINLNTWFLSNPDSESIEDLIKGFYFRKSVEPAVWYSGFFLLLFIGGVISHLRYLVSIFTHKSPQTRKIIDFILSVTFMANIYFMIKHVAPLEKEIGNLFGQDKPMELLSAVESLNIYHIISMSVSVFMIILNILAFQVHSKHEKKIKKE
eukprot:TRINITY_DN5912_c0_g1_i1.p1 TRINITY_DN5912_c0_g1~~TRINITY_DN5912_c0_g1_i1.p1  ORF type:complete len:187 (-),score=33.34 TRINITY_DN5912_c0_g1_i1:83-643(-)